MLAQGKKVLFIVNPYSGTGYSFSVEDRIQDICAKNNAQCTIEHTKSRGHAILLSRDAATNGFDYVVAVGGDGTINEVAQGLLDTATPMGILPRGSGNGLARHFGIPAYLPGAIDNLFTNTVIRMDTLTINNRLSLNVSGIGFDGHVANLFANRKIRGLFGYARLTVKELFNFSEFGSEITIDGKTSTAKAFIIAVANSSQYGNNIKVAPSASVCDGLLDLTIMRKVPLYNVGFIYSFLKGKLEKSVLCDMVVATEALIKTSRPVPYHVDGESCGSADSFFIQIKPASLAVLVPEGFRNNEQ